MKKIKDIHESDIDEIIIGFLINITLFDGLSPDELKTVANYMSCIELDNGDVVFEEGQKGDYVCFIVNGTLEVFKESVTGESVVITSLSKGRSIGEMSIIDKFPRSATIKARTQATLVILERKDFDLISEEYPKIGIKILKGISRLLSLNLRKTSGRLADYMLPLS